MTGDQSGVTVPVAKWLTISTLIIITVATCSGASSPVAVGTPARVATSAATSSGPQPAATISSSPSGSPVATTGPSPTTAAPLSQRPAPTASASSGKEIAGCVDGQITVTAEGGQAVTGHFFDTIHVALVGDQPCILEGYPGAEITTSTGTKINATRSPDATEHGAVPVERVLLTTGASVVSSVEWIDQPSGQATSCPTSRNR